jgi:Ras GTPase-activating-like protein IQGAP2/3
LVNQENLLEKTASDLDRLQGVLDNIQQHHNFLQEQYDAYKEYLNNVRSKSCAGPTAQKKQKKEKPDKKSGKKSKTPAVAKPKGPFKYSHSTLEKDGIIIESEVPEDRFVLKTFNFKDSINKGLILTIFY